MSEAVVTILRWLIDLALKGTVAVGLALTALLLLRRYSAAARHLLLTASLTFLLLLPFAAPMVPGLSLPVLPANLLGAPVPTMLIQSSEMGGVLEEQSAAIAPAPDAEPLFLLPDWRDLVPMIWFGGVLLLGAWFLLGLIRVRLLVKHSRVPESMALQASAAVISKELGLDGDWKLRLSDETGVPLVIGMVRPTVVLPGDAGNWPEARLEMALRHELAHVMRRDLLLQLPALLGTILFWFNPLVWFAAHRQTLEREQACDDLVLCAGFRPSDYADHLLDTARKLTHGPLLRWASIGMARGADFKVRMKAILAPHGNRSALSGNHALAIIALSILIMLPIAAWRPWAETGINTAPIVEPAEPAVSAQDQSGTGAGIASDKQERNENRIYEAGKESGVPEPKLISKIEPDYPAAAREAGIEGRVQISAIVGKTGVVEEIRIVKEEPFGYGFADKAREAIKRWTFEPVVLDGKPVRVRINFSADFSLKQKMDEREKKGEDWTSAEREAPVEVAGDIVSPKVIFPAIQPFPAAAKEAGVGGKVRLRLIVHDNRSVEIVDVEDEEPIGFGFAELAKQYVANAEWTPALRNGKPVSVYYSITILFALKASSDFTDMPDLPIEVAGDVYKPEVRFPGVQPFPAAAKEAHKGGKVKLRLIVRKDGSVEVVTILKEDPEGLGFAEAAKEYVMQAQWTPAKRDGKAVSVLYEITILFAVRNDSPNPKPAEIADDMIAPKVTFDYPLRLPDKAALLRRGGTAQLRLIIRRDGTWEFERVVSEEPANFGFAQAAIDQLAGSHWTPATRDGKPIDVYVNQTFTFQIPDTTTMVNRLPALSEGGDRGPHSALFPVISVIPAYPPAALSARVAGRVVVSAQLKSDGSVGEVTILKEAPTGYGFAAAVTSAIKQWHFKVQGIRGNISIMKDFYFDPKRERVLEGNVTPDIDWDAYDVPPRLQQVGRMVYPARAVRIGMAGTATVRVTVGADGHFKDATVVSESRPNLGFGAAVVENARRAIWEPALKDGKAVEAVSMLTIQFPAIPRANNRFPGAAEQFMSADSRKLFNLPKDTGSLEIQ